jgi:lipoprotein-anchoring transpeptidase ErfK/SrfK
MELQTTARIVEFYLGSPSGLWLNLRVRRNSKSLSSRPHRKRRGGWRWLLALIVVAVVAWFWWRHEHPPTKVVRPPAKAVAPRPQPFVVAHESAADFPRPVRDVFEAQVALARRAISSGSIDAALGSQTRRAISVYQETQHLPVTGTLNADTRARLMLAAPLVTTYVVTAGDLARLQPLGKTWLAKSQQTALEFETELELVAEKSHSHPELIRRLNLNVNWTNIAAGTVLQVPDVDYPTASNKAAFAVIHLADKFLEAFDQETNLLAHFPCSIAANVEKRPVGELHVIVVAPNPNYTFDPELFPESPEGKTLDHKLILPPGPNNPVGVAWIGLDKTGYGIHGTPIPEQVGRTESHGCFRLANWDAEFLSKLVWVGMPVLVEP